MPPERWFYVTVSQQLLENAPLKGAGAGGADEASVVFGGV